jgi:hypothetical protein
MYPSIGLQTLFAAAEIDSGYTNRTETRRRRSARTTTSRFRRGAKGPDSPNPQSAVTTQPGTQRQSQVTPLAATNSTLTERSKRGHKRSKPVSAQPSNERSQRRRSIVHNNKAAPRPVALGRSQAKPTKSQLREQLQAEVERTGIDVKGIASYKRDKLKQVLK